MVIKGARTIAEYAIRRWMEEQGFVMEYFTLVMDGNEGKLEDRQGDSLILVYDGATRSVHVKGEVGRKMGMNEFEAIQCEEQGMGLKLLAESRKQAAERLRQLINSNFKNDEVEIKVSYDICLSKTDTSLLIVNKR